MSNDKDRYEVQDSSDSSHAVVDTFFGEIICICKTYLVYDSKATANLIAAALNEKFKSELKDYGVITSDWEEIAIWSGYQDIIFKKDELMDISEYFQNKEVLSDDIRNYCALKGYGREATEDESGQLNTQDYIIDEEKD